jgi:hypothetical protein
MKRCFAKEQYIKENERCLPSLIIKGKQIKLQKDIGICKVFKKDHIYTKGWPEPRRAESLKKCAKNQM